MERKHRKQPLKAAANSIQSTVGYIRLSVANKEESCSAENQKLIMGQWGAGMRSLRQCTRYCEESCRW